MKKLMLCLVLAGCAEAVRPVILSAPTPAASAVDAAVRVLAQRGHTAARVNNRAGVVTSEWQPTSYLYGKGPHDEDMFIVRRFIVTVTPGADGTSQLRVGGEDMRCADAMNAVGDGGVLNAGCQMVDGVVPPDQAEINAIGADLGQALGVAPPPAVSAK